MGFSSPTPSRGWLCNPTLSSHCHNEACILAQLLGFSPRLLIFRFPKRVASDLAFCERCQNCMLPYWIMCCMHIKITKAFLSPLKWWVVAVGVAGGVDYELVLLQINVNSWVGPRKICQSIWIDLLTEENCNTWLEICSILWPDTIIGGLLFCFLNKGSHENPLNNT